MAWCGQAMQCLPWVGNDAYSRVSTKEDDGAAHAQLEQSTTWADNTTVRLDGTVSAVSAVDAVDASTGSALDAKTEAWLSKACAALDEIGSPLSVGEASARSRSVAASRSGLSEEIAVALNGSRAAARAAEEGATALVAGDTSTGLASCAGSVARASPRFSSDPARAAAKARGNRSFGGDLTNASPNASVSASPAKLPPPPRSPAAAEATSKSSLRTPGGSAYAHQALV